MDSSTASDILELKASERMKDASRMLCDLKLAAGTVAGLVADLSGWRAFELLTA